MKKYKLSDFPGGFVRGKYASRLRKSSNIVVLRPEVAEAFPNEEAVNKALLSLIDVAQKTTRLRRRSTGRAKKSIRRLAARPYENSVEITADAMRAHYDFSNRLPSGWIKLR